MTIQPQAFKPFGPEIARRKILPLLLVPGAFVMGATDLARASVAVAAAAEVRVIEAFDFDLISILTERGWIEPVSSEGARVARWCISAKGRREARSAGDDAGALPPPADPLDFFARPGPTGAPFLPAPLLAAAAGVRADFALSDLSPDRLLADWETMLTAGEWPGDLDGLPDSVAFSRSRLRAALDNAGRGLGDALIRVVCLWEPISAFEESQGLPVRSGKVVLRMALERAAQCAGVPAAPAPVPPSIPAPRLSNVRAHVARLPEVDRLPYCLDLIEALIGPDVLSPEPWRALGLSLSPQELRIVSLLAANRGSAVHRDRLFAAAHPCNPGAHHDPRSIDAAISRVRRKLAAVKSPIKIKAEHSFGYVLTAPAELDLPGSPGVR